MDQIKIGKFISNLRKEKGLTQLELANALYVSDRAVSKWENGKCLPDSSIMLDLCQILEISVNELLSGEKIEMKDYDKEAEKNLLEISKQKESSDKRLLRMEILLGIASLIILAGCIAIGFTSNYGDTINTIIVIVGFVQFVIFALFAIRIEQKAGYYECKKCGHKYVPTYSSVLWAMHIGRTRYMKCPNCKKRSWQKKLIEK